MIWERHGSIDDLRPQIALVFWGTFALGFGSALLLPGPLVWLLGGETSSFALRNPAVVIHLVGWMFLLAAVKAFQLDSGPFPQRPRGHRNRDSGGRPVLRMGVSPGGFHGARILPCCGWLPSSLAGGVVLHRDFDRRGAPLARPLIRSRKAPSGSFAFTTPVARSTPDVPSSIAFATSLRVCTPAPHRTTIFGFTARIRSTARETTSGFAVVTLTSPPINSGGSIAMYSGESFARVSASAMSSAQATTSRPSF